MNTYGKASKTTFTDFAVWTEPTDTHMNEGPNKDVDLNCVKYSNTLQSVTDGGRDI